MCVSYHVACETGACSSSRQSVIFSAAARLSIQRNTKMFLNNCILLEQDYTYMIIRMALVSLDGSKCSPMRSDLS